MGWIVVAVAAAVLLLNALIHLFFALLILPVFERKLPFNVEPSAPKLDAERIEIPTTHELTLRGSLYRQASQPARGLIVFCPELGGNHWSAMTYCEALWVAGFDILAFDFRNQGESDSMPGYEPMHWLTEYEVADALAVCNYVSEHRELSLLPLGLFGISRGGAAALAAAARCPDARCIACESTFSTMSLMTHYTLRWASLYVPDWVMRPIPGWHLTTTLHVVQWLSQLRRRCRYTNLERLLSRLRDRPVWLIAGKRDSYVPPEIARMLCVRIGAACQGVWVVPKAKHNGSRPVEPQLYDRRLGEFFSRAMADTAAEASSSSTAS